jgi:hypothetical protein
VTSVQPDPYLAREVDESSAEPGVVARIRTFIPPGSVRIYVDCLASDSQLAECRGDRIRRWQRASCLEKIRTAAPACMNGHRRNGHLVSSVTVTKRQPLFR